MNKLKAIVLATTLVLILGVSTLFISTSTNANNDWTVQVLSNASSEIGATGYHLKEEIKTRSIAVEMGKTLDPVIEEQQAELERLLEEYYQLKLKNLLSSEQAIAIQSRIVEIRTDVYNRYTKEIDLLFQ